MPHTPDSPAFIPFWDTEAAIHFHWPQLRPIREVNSFAAIVAVRWDGESASAVDRAAARDAVEHGGPFIDLSLAITLENGGIASDAPRAVASLTTGRIWSITPETQVFHFINARPALRRT